MVGSTAWERAGGPPLSMAERLTLLRHASVVVAGDLFHRLLWIPRPPRKIDLAAWAPPDSAAARQATGFLREGASAEVVSHSLRTWYFAGIQYELAASKPPLDREALYVAAVMHDACLTPRTPPPPHEHCFTVACAREARRIAAAAGWDEARLDRMALAITSNLNGSVPLEQFGAEAHFLTAGGEVEVLAQEWKVHPENLAEILHRHPRTHMAEDLLPRVAAEAKRNPGCRFDCLNPLFPFMVRRSSFGVAGG